MPNELSEPDLKAAAGYARRIFKFIGIFLLVFISQVPGCVVVLADDAGQINYFEYENLIEFSKLTFAFPLRLMINKINSEGQLLLIYLGNLVILTSLIILIMFIWRGIKDRILIKK